jgi:hypothetical protein
LNTTTASAAPPIGRSSLDLRLTAKDRAGNDIPHAFARTVAMMIAFVGAD